MIEKYIAENGTVVYWATKPEEKDLLLSVLRGKKLNVEDPIEGPFGWNFKISREVDQAEFENFLLIASISMLVVDNRKTRE